MKVIFLKDNQVKEVALGYAVNYLLPKKLAVIATEKKLAEIIKKETEVVLAKNQEAAADQQTVVKLEAKTLNLKVKAGKNGKIHGSITKKEIAQALKVLKTNIVLDEPIKKLGEYNIEIKFGKAKGKIQLVVVAE